MLRNENVEKTLNYIKEYAQNAEFKQLDELLLEEKNKISKDQEDQEDQEDQYHNYIKHAIYYLAFHKHLTQVEKYCNDEAFYLKSKDQKGVERYREQDRYHEAAVGLAYSQAIAVTAKETINTFSAFTRYFLTQFKAVLNDGYNKVNNHATISALIDKNLHLRESLAIPDQKSVLQYNQEKGIDLSELVKGITFEEFKKAYYLEYNSAWFKNPKSTMKCMLENGLVKNMEDVQAYAQTPGTRTHSLLQKIQNNKLQDSLNERRDDMPSVYRTIR